MPYFRANKLSDIQDVFTPYPLEAIDEIKTYYQNTTEARTGDIYGGFVEKMELLLEDSHNSFIHRLFVGHAGVGKTTELYRLFHSAQEMGFLTCFGRCDMDLDSGDIEYTDVLLYLLDLLVTQAANKQLKMNERIVKKIENYWNTDTELSKTISLQAQAEFSLNIQAETGILKIAKLLAEIRGILKNSNESKKIIRTRIEPRSSELISQIKEVILEISNQLSQSGKPSIPFVILDGLDKIPLSQARKIFQENGSRFQSLQVHLLVTFPISLSYTPEYKDIQIWFPNPAKLPMIKLRNWQNGAYVPNYTEGMETLKQIVQKRAELSLFAQDALDELITFTGGYLRDLFRCICEAALRARLRKSSRIEISDARKALEVLESDINGRYGAELIGKMQEIYRGQKYVSSSEEITTLLQSGVVLEYNGSRWCDLHPLAEKWLLQNGKISP